MLMLRTITVLILFSLLPLSLAYSQATINITGPQKGFPIAIPKLCAQGEMALSLPEKVASNLTFSGVFRVINPAAYVEGPGNCDYKPEDISFSDWSLIGAEGLVKGKITPKGDGYQADMYLYDVVKQRPVLGKRYQLDESQITTVANKFSNEIIGFFTGVPGVFGSKIAFTSKTGRFKELFVMEIDGSGLKQLTKDRGLVVSPSWLPIGDQIYYTSYATRRPELYALDVEVGSKAKVTNFGSLITGAIWSPDGARLIASLSQNGFTNLVELSREGKIIRNITNGSSIDVSPTWSPDGLSIAYTSSRGGGPQIYVKEMGSSRRVSFTGSNYCTSPAWSPLGDRIAFVCRSSGNQIFMANPDGSRLTQLTFSGNNEDPDWAPDGRSLVFSSTAHGRGRKDIVVLSLINGQITRITSPNTEDTQPVWSKVAS